MNRQEFIMRGFLAVMPANDHAPALFEKLSNMHLWLERRLAAEAKPKADPKPQARLDWYARLDEAQRAGFDRFWKAYSHKIGRNEAAMVWGNLPDGILPGEEGWIIHAAAAEAKRWRDAPPQGQTRIYAQGWLSAFRWRDHPRPSAEGGPAKSPEGIAPEVKRSILLGEIANLKRLLGAAHSEKLAAQLTAKEAELRELVA